MKLILSMLILMSIQLSATITCEIRTATDISFGDYDVFDIQDLDTRNRIITKCKTDVGETVTYTLALSTGYSGSYLTRKMTNGVDELNYNIFGDTGRTQIWGDGTNGTTVKTRSFYMDPNRNYRKRHRGKGRIPALQDVSIGNYSDSIVVQMSY